MYTATMNTASECVTCSVPTNLDFYLNVQLPNLLYVVYSTIVHKTLYSFCLWLTHKVDGQAITSCSSAYIGITDMSPNFLCGMSQEMLLI